MTVAKKQTSRRERERRARFELILGAGARMFAEHGYDGTTMEMVAEEAELGKATLYYYFDTKRALFAELVSTGAARLTELARDRLGDGASADDLCQVALSFFADYPDLAAVLMPMMAADPGQASERLGTTGARELHAAHGPLFAALAPFAERLPNGHALPHLVASLFVGLAAKSQQGSAEHTADELRLFFDILTAADKRT